AHRDARVGGEDHLRLVPLQPRHRPDELVHRRPGRLRVRHRPVRKAAFDGHRHPRRGADPSGVLPRGGGDLRVCLDLPEHLPHHGRLLRDPCLRGRRGPLGPAEGDHHPGHRRGLRPPAEHVAAGHPRGAGRCLQRCYPALRGLRPDGQRATHPTGGLPRRDRRARGSARVDPHPPAGGRAAPTRGNQAMTGPQRAHAVAVPGAQSAEQPASPENPRHIDARVTAISAADLAQTLTTGPAPATLAELRDRLNVRAPVSDPADWPRGVADALVTAGIDVTGAHLGRSRRYGFHYLRWLDPLARAYALTGDPRYPHTFSQRIRDWESVRDGLVGQWPGLDIIWYSLGCW